MLFKRLMLILAGCMMIFGALPIAAQTGDYAQAESAYLSGDYMQALNILNTLLTETPDDVNSLLLRARTRLSLQLIDPAAADATRALTLAPNRAEPYIVQGLIDAARGNSRAALRQFQTATEIDPTAPEGFALLGQLYFGLGNLQRALQSYDQAIALDPKSAVYIYERGLLYETLGEVLRAIDDYSAAITLDPQNLRYYETRAFAYYRIGDLDGAIADANEQIRIAPERPQTYLNRGYYQYEKGALADASIDYWQWVQRIETQRFDYDPLTEFPDRQRLRMEYGYVHVFPLSVERPSLITISATSPTDSVDSLVIILDANGNPITVDDDGGNGTDALLRRYALPDLGAYTLIVSHAGGGSAGTITLRVDRIDNYGDV